MSNILVTGGTGFVGRSLIRQLTEAGHRVRILIRPAETSPNLPKGVSIDVVVAGLKDQRGLRAAMVDIDTVYHLAGAEWHGAYASLLDIDIDGTRLVSTVAAEAGIDRLFYISHLGADRASAYPVMKAKAIAEEYIRRSGVDFTIFRSAVVFGPGDGFTTGLGFILKFFPFIYLMPGDGKTLLQPIWIEDLVTSLTWALDDLETRNQTYEIGGAEYLTMSQIVALISEILKVKRFYINVSAPYLRALTVILESIFPSFPISVYWLDYLASNRTCALDTLPRVFHLMPERFSASSLAYLGEINWRQELWHRLRLRKRLKKQRE
jgi:uncharacterized protein YbjT (DUF2867 family)